MNQSPEESGNDNNFGQLAERQWSLICTVYPGRGLLRIPLLTITGAGERKEGLQLPATLNKMSIVDGKEEQLVPPNKGCM